ncbi:MAG: hypothetical protein GY769_01750 [bacterium]|nr:hypothetical protein [bacterium]
MKRIHILRTTSAAAEYESLFAAAADLGLRIGWLDLAGDAGIPAELEEAARLGALRAVGVTANRVVTVKPVRGAKVLKDLLREHFSGCRLVVIRGELEAPELEVALDGYRVRFEDGTAKDFSAKALARALRSPRLRGAAGPESRSGSGSE